VTVEEVAPERVIGFVVAPVCDERRVELSGALGRATSVVCTTPWTTTRVPGGGNCREGVRADCKGVVVAVVVSACVGEVSTVGRSGVALGSSKVSGLMTTCSSGLSSPSSSSSSSP
jgi:hypothetical protein